MSGGDTLDLEIAIVGMAGRFPGASSVEAYWRNLRAGVESIRDLSEEELRAAGLDDAALADPRLVRRAADVQDADLFDAGLFGMTPREAELTDPQLRVFLEEARTALEEAGIFGDGRDGRVGVFAGAGSSTYFFNNVAGNGGAVRSVGIFQTSLGNEKDYLAPQVSYRLDLRGPSVVVQTACSTSLVAVHLACQSLIGRECEVALAGGVSITYPQASGYLHEEGDIASPDGKCRAFDASAAGCVKGDGCGVVVLKRLSDALRDGDRIRAVVKGSAINNDGSLKVGFTAPSVEGQAGVIAEAMAAAGVEPRSIAYVEAHGTATALGDPVEVAALAKAFAPSSGRTARCALGSVKTNVGHLDAAAGVAGLIKTVLALEHREIPPSLNFERPNPGIDFASAPFYVNTELRLWEANGVPRRAGVSSFGIGGTNAHVILEEAPATVPAGPARGTHLLVVSAATESALASASESLAKALEDPSGPDLADAAFTLQTGRRRLSWRRAVVASDRGAAAAALRSGEGPGAPHHDERRATEVAFLFPGQGSQHLGMARSLHEEEPAFREIFDRCAGILRPILDVDLRKAIFPPEGREAAAEERLRGTALAQPALFAVEYALAHLWRSWGIRPAAMAGHSIGEYVAACLAGVISLEDALAIVAERGRLMGGLPGGSMLAVHIGEADLARRLEAHPSLSLAAINAPAACVASGPDEAIARLEGDLSAEGVACTRLHTSHAFHSGMMEPILSAFEARLRRATLAPPSIPFLSNLTGTWITDAQAVDPGYWVSHLRRTVRFADNVSALAEGGSRALLEVGPGTALASLARLSRIEAPGETTIVSSLPHPKSGADDLAAIHEALGRLWCAGADPDWDGFHAGRRRLRVALPTYPYERRRYFVEPGAPAGTAAEAATGKNPDPAAWFYVPGWKRSLLRAASETEGGGWLILDDGSETGSELARLATEGGEKVSRVTIAGAYGKGDDGALTIDPERRSHYDDLVRDLLAEGPLPRRIVHLWCADGSSPDGAPAVSRGFLALLHLLQALGQAGGLEGARLLALARELFDVTGGKALRPERAALAGLCRVAPMEYPGLTCRLADVDGGDAGEIAGRIAAEMDSADREPVVAWRGGHRWVPSYERVRVEAPASDPDPIRPGGTYLITGGSGPLERALAARLAAAGASGIILTGCAAEEPPWSEEIRAAGCQLLVAGGDVTDAAATGDAIARGRARFGRLDAVFHTAGEIGGGMIQLKDRESAERILAPRLGAAAIAGLLGPGETLVLFSSAVSATGVFGQADYCGASAFLDAFAHSRHGEPGPRVMSIDWSVALWDRWQQASGPGGEALMAQLREIQDSIGITIDEGVDALWRALALGVPQAVVSTQDLDELIAQSASASVTDFLEGMGGAPAGAGREGREVAPLESATERRVAAIWSELLGIERIGRTDNFFDLGGNSLLAIQLASQLRRSFEIDLTIASLFEAADVAALSASVDRAVEERRQADEVASLLDEIESLSEAEVRAQLGGGVDAGAAR